MPLLAVVEEYLARHEGFESGVALHRIVAEFIETKVRVKAALQERFEVRAAER